MGQQFHIGNQARGDAIGDQVAELLLGLQRLCQADHVAGSIGHPDQHQATGAVGESHKGLEQVLGRGEIALAFEGLALGGGDQFSDGSLHCEGFATTQIEGLGSMAQRSRRSSLNSARRTERRSARG